MQGSLHYAVHDETMTSFGRDDGFGEAEKKIVISSHPILGRLLEIDWQLIQDVDCVLNRVITMGRL